MFLIELFLHIAVLAVLFCDIWCSVSNVIDFFSPFIVVENVSITAGNCCFDYHIYICDMRLLLMLLLIQLPLEHLMQKTFNFYFQLFNNKYAIHSLLN